MFALSNMVSGSAWLVFVPLASIIHEHMGFSYTFINLFAASYGIGYLLMDFPASALLETKGLRFALLLAALLNCLGLWLRTLLQTNPVAALFGQFVAALTSPVFLNVPPKLAVTWFKPRWTSIATTVAASSTLAGNVLSLCLAAFLVGEGDNFSPNSVYQLLMVFAILASAMFLIVLAFFLDRPTRPPSRAAEVARPHGPWRACRKLLCDYDFIGLTLVCSLAGWAYTSILE